MTLNRLLKTCCFALFTIAFAYSGYASAQVAGSADDRKTHTETTESHTILDTTQLRRMSSRLCRALNLGRTDENFDIEKSLNGILLEHAELKYGEHSKKDLAEFWNAHAPGVICTPTSGLYPTQHLFKRAVVMNVHSEALIGYFLQDHIAFPIDVNIVETHRGDRESFSDGTQATLLDFLDLILSQSEARERFNLGQILRLRRILEIRYAGKRVHEMGVGELDRRTEEYNRLMPSRP